MKYIVVTTAPWTAPNGDIVPAGVGVNIIEADAGFNPGPGLALAIPAGQTMWAPKQVIQVPSQIDLWKAKAVLAAQPSKHNAGKTLLNDADAAVAAAGGALALAWGNAAVITRSSPATAAMGAALGLSGADLDALFIAASEVSI